MWAGAPAPNLPGMKRRWTQHERQAHASQPRCPACGSLWLTPPRKLSGYRSAVSLQFPPPPNSPMFSTFTNVDLRARLCVDCGVTTLVATNRRALNELRQRIHTIAPE